MDEAVFIRVGTNEKKLWSPIGEPISIKRGGKRDRIVVYGALTEDGTQMMRSHEKFDGHTFVKYLEEIHRKWGRVLIIMDNASQHKHGAVRRYLEKQRHGDSVSAHCDSQA